MQDLKIDELEKQVKYLEKELDESHKAWDLDLKNHQRRETALVNTLAEKNEEIEKLKELNEYLRNQLRMSTDMLKETRLKIETKDAEIEKFKKEPEKTRICKNVEIGMLKEENERLKTEVTEALAKRDYWQDLANKEAADAKKVKLDCEKEIEWQKKKLQEFDYVLTKYRAKIKELEDANGFSELVINLIIKE